MKPFPKQICFNCGKKYATPKDYAVGAWLGKCDVCSEIYKTVKNMPGWYLFVEDAWGNKAANNELPKLKKEIKERMNGELKHKWGDEITEQMIENARNYPIENLIDLNQRGFAVCPFHDDKKPNAFCKNNFLYCFSCNESADPIKLYMHLFGCNFKTAILNLQQCSDTSPTQLK